MAYAIIQIEDRFAILNTASNCAYGRFDSSEEATEAIQASQAASKAHAYAPANIEEVKTALEVTASNIRSLGPAGVLSTAPFKPYQTWLEVVERALAGLQVP